MLHSFCKKLFEVLTFAGILLTLPSYTPTYALAASSGRQLFNIADYGAKKDGSVPATDAFRQAIQAAKAAGGGTIYVPAGKYEPVSGR
jgi:polygalacturonase